MNRQKLLYLGVYDKHKFKGIHLKVSDTLIAARAMGYISHTLIFEKQSIKSIFKMCIVIIKSNADIFIIRSINPFTFLFTPFFILARLQRKKLIYDNVTPMISTFIDSNIHFKSSIVKKIKNILLFLMNGPWSYYFFDKIVQYGNEHWYFRFGNNSRTILIGNGINQHRINIRNKNYTWPSNQLRLVAVATLVEYQGIDRVIHAVSIWNAEKHAYSVRLDVIGDGPHLPYLQKLVKEKHLEALVFFHGRQDQNYIHTYYSKAHIGVSALSLYKVSLKVASAMKAREYCLSGLPFIATGIDPDFADGLPFVFKVSNDHHVEGIIRIFKNYPEMYPKLIDSDIRQYAIENLSFISKLKAIGL